MATIKASSQGWLSSLDLNSDYAHPNGDPESTYSLRFLASGGGIFLAIPRGMGGQDNPNLTYVPSIQGSGYHFQTGSENNSGITPGLFYGKTLDIGYQGAFRGPAQGEGHFSGTISGIDYQVETQTIDAFPYIFTYAGNPLSSAQGSGLPPSGGPGSKLVHRRSRDDGGVSERP